jgi:hypothetical protein
MYTFIDYFICFTGHVNRYQKYRFLFYFSTEERKDIQVFILFIDGGYQDRDTII